MTAEPGWRWSEHLAAIAGTDSCQASHLGVLVSDAIHIVHDDVTEVDFHAGDTYRIEPGHDAWGLGDELVVTFEFKSAETYAKAWLGSLRIEAADGRVHLTSPSVRRASYDDVMVAAMRRHTLGTGQPRANSVRTGTAPRPRTRRPRRSPRRT